MICIPFDQELVENKYRKNNFILPKKERLFINENIISPFPHLPIFYLFSPVQPANPDPTLIRRWYGANTTGSVKIKVKRKLM
jgi:hypothetical protein